jgi:hypothetical protein
MAKELTVYHIVDLDSGDVLASTNRLDYVRLLMKRLEMMGRDCDCLGW